MGVESGARPSNTLSGELRSRPLPVLLAGACERGTSGTFTFRCGTRIDVVCLRGGKIAGVRTSDPIAYLGGILYELGAIDIETLSSTLLEVANHKRLHGDILLRSGAITHEGLHDGLVEQTLRKVHHVFTLPEETLWSFRDDVDDLAGARDEDRPAVDTWHAIWRGMCDQPAAPHVRRTLATITGAIKVRDLEVLDRFVLTGDERAVCERLFLQPSTVARIVASSPLAADRTEQLVYLLALSRSIVRIDVPAVGPAELDIEGVRERARRIDTEDAYTILGVRPGSSLEAVRSAYFRLARVWHPDKVPDDMAKVLPECEHVFKRLAEAHRTVIETHTQRPESAENPRTEATFTGLPTAPPAASMREVDAALARNDLEVADALARTLASAGSDGPSARAVVAWCGAGAGMSTSHESLERALVALERIVVGDPDCVRGVYYRGQISKRLGRVDAAVRDFRKVVRLEPRHLDALRELRLYEMRHRSVGGEPDRPATTTSSAARAARSDGSARPANTNAGPEIREGCASPATESTSVRSGLRRLVGLVAGK